MSALSPSNTRLQDDTRLAALVASIGDVYYVLDRDWRVALLNKEAAEIYFERPPSEVVGRLLWDLFPGAERSPFTAVLKRGMDEGVAGRLTRPSENRPGHYQEYRVAPLGDEGLGVCVIDVTERVLAEQATREARERLDLAVGAHSIGIYDWDVPTGRVVWSPEMEVIFGLGAGTFEGAVDAFQARVLPEDLPRALAETDAAVKAGQDLVHYDFRIRRGDGAIRWIEGSARVVYREDGAPVRIVGTNVDVTDRVMAQGEVRASRERLDLAVGAHAIGIFDWDLPSGAATWTGEMEEIFGLPRGTFEGHTDHFRRRVLPEDLARIEAETAEALAAGKDLVHYEFRIRRDDGAVRWIEGSARFVFGADGAPVRMVGTNVDITERKAAEQHQRLLVNELNHRVKNTLAIVQAIAWQSFRSSGASRLAREAFEGRLAALASAHDILTRQDWDGGSIGQILASAVAPHDPGGGRLTATGPTVTLDPKAAVALALAMHELATNAVKYGALSTPEGRVEVAWTIEGDVLDLTWRETGGPPVAGSIKRGFGTRLLEQGLSEELKGTVRLEFRPEGLVCLVKARLA